MLIVCMVLCSLPIIPCKMNSQNNLSSGLYINEVDQRFAENKEDLPNKTFLDYLNKRNLNVIQLFTQKVSRYEHFNETYL